MRDHTTKRSGRFAKGRRRGGRNGRPRGRRGPNGSRRRNVNGNRLRRRGGKGETAVCIKCGHPAPDGKLCRFHRQLLNIFRKEVPDQDPRRFRF